MVIKHCSLSCMIHNTIFFGLKQFNDHSYQNSCQGLSELFSVQAHTQGGAGVCVCTDSVNIINDLFCARGEIAA